MNQNINQKKEFLQQKIAVVNEINHHMNLFHTEMVEIFTPFIGQKIKTTSNDLVHKIKKILPNNGDRHIKTDRGFEITISYLHNSNSLCWSFVNQKGIYLYKELYVGYVADQNLSTLAPYPNLKCNYNYDDIIEIVAELRKHENAISQIKNSLMEFEQKDIFIAEYLSPEK